MHFNNYMYNTYIFIYATTCIDITKLQREFYQIVYINIRLQRNLQGNPLDPSITFMNSYFQLNIH